MVAISFTVFKEKILSGAKDQTIRKWNPKRIAQMKRSRKLQLYWKQRTKECEFLREVELERIFRIKIKADPFQILIFREFSDFWDCCRKGEEQVLILRDGFGSIEEFLDFFKRYDLETQEFSVIQWKNTKDNGNYKTLLDFLTNKGESN